MAHDRRRCLSLAVDDGTHTGTFLAIARLREDALTLDGVRIGIGEWNDFERLPARRAGDGFARVGLAAAGVLVDAQGDVLLQRLFLDGAVVRCVIAVPGLGTLEGPFRVTRLDCQEIRLARPTSRFRSSPPVRSHSRHRPLFAGDRDENKRGEIDVEFGGTHNTLCLTLGALSEL